MIFKSWRVLFLHWSLIKVTDGYVACWTGMFYGQNRSLTTTGHTTKTDMWWGMFTIVQEENEWNPDKQRQPSWNSTASVFERKMNIEWTEVRSMPNRSCISVFICYTYKHVWCDMNGGIHIIYYEFINVCIYLCVCACAHGVKSSLFCDFFLPAECGRWSQAQSDTAIKQHLVEMGWSPLHLWPSWLSVCVCTGVHVCPTASRSVGTPWPVCVMVPTWILCEMRQKSRKTHQLEDAKEEKRFRQLWKYLLSGLPNFPL